jgi:proteic killer suppression protein
LRGWWEENGQKSSIENVAERHFAQQLLIVIDTNNALRYHLFIIRSFASKETERLFRRQFSRKLPQDIQRRARIKLEILDAAEQLDDLRIPPSNHLEKLFGDRVGQHSVRNNQWRVCFTWRDGDAYDVEIVDYH